MAGSFTRESPQLSFPVEDKHARGSWGKNQEKITAIKI